VSGRVLVADADAGRARHLCERLAARGLTCSVAEHGAAALEAALASVPDVVVADPALPLIDGRRLAAILHANPRTCTTRVIFLGDGGRGPAEAVVDAADGDAVARRVESVIAERGPDPAPEPGAGGAVEGQLAQLPLRDLLQLFHVSLKTGSIDLSRPGAGGSSETGRVFLRGGDVIQAVAGPVEGEKALHRLLAWERGSFSFRAAPVAMAPRIQTPTRALLREAVRQQEEWRRATPELPPPDARVVLRVPRSELPNVIHPVTQEVLLTLEVHSRVSDVVDHTTFPDYQVLRALQTLAARGIVEIKSASAAAEARGAKRLFGPTQAARLREWLDGGRAGAEGRARDAVVLIAASGPEAVRSFGRALLHLPGFEPPADPAAAAPGPDDLLTLGRLAVEDDLGIELVHLPAGEAFAPVWPLAGHGALAALLLLSGPVTQAAHALDDVASVLRRVPRSRLFHLLLLGRGQRLGPDDLRDHLSLLDEGSLFLVPQEPGREQEALLREVFSRLVP